MLAATSAPCQQQFVTIIFVAKTGLGLGCMGLGLLRDDSDTSRIAAFIKGTSRDLINGAHSTTKK
jgi:hypothetical protein